MKNCFLLLAVFFSTMISAQKKLITAEITGFNDHTKVKLFDQDLGKLLDSTFVVNNKFTLQHHIVNPVPKNLTLAIFVDGIPHFTRLFIANDNVKITGDKTDIPYDLKITGSKNQDIENILNDQVKTIAKERIKIEQFWRSERDSSKAYKERLRLSNERAAEIDAEDAKITMNFINKNLNTYTALNYLRYLKYDYSTEELRKIYQRLDEKFKKSENGKALLTYIEIGDIIKEGDLFSDFEAQDKNGKIHKLSDFKGQFILLDFTKEFCAPCELAIKEMKKIDEKYKEKIKIISFNGEKSEVNWKKGLVRNNINWLSLWDGQGNDGKTLMKYGVQGFPHFFFIDQKGKIVKASDGYEYIGVLDVELQKLMSDSTN